MFSLANFLSLQYSGQNKIASEKNTRRRLFEDEMRREIDGKKKFFNGYYHSEQIFK
jgi:hypothetical protein